MPRTTIDRLIINSPYEEPARHWRYERETRTFDLVDGRRPAGYVVASPDSRAFDDYNDPDVKDDLNRRAQPEEPLPDLVPNAYYLLGYDWREALKAWREAGLPTPPVMITVCNRTETAARVKHAFDSRRIHIDELCDPERILHIDSKVLDQAEAQEEPAPLGVLDESNDAEKEDAPVERNLTKAEQMEGGG